MSGWILGAVFGAVMWGGIYMSGYYFGRAAGRRIQRERTVRISNYLSPAIKEEIGKAMVDLVKKQQAARDN